MLKYIVAVFIIFTIGFFVGVATEKWMPGQSKLKEECEKSLPRNKHCVMKFVPEKEIKSERLPKLQSGISI